MTLGESQVEDALFLAHASEAAYADNPRPYEPSLGFERLLTFDCERTKTFGYVARRGDDLVVAFRGTDDAYDWLTNADADLVEWGWGKVHHGFERALLSVREQIERYRRELSEGRPVAREWICGHSLGGALACLYGSGGTSGIYTFGQPRVGDGEFGNGMRGSLVRYVCAGDGVTTLPPVTMGYEHCGREVTLECRGHEIDNYIAVLEKMVFSDGV